MYSRQEWISFASWGIIYSIAFHIFWLLSLSLLTMPSTVSWFLPAGLRISVFLLAPLRCWPFLYLFERVGFILAVESGVISANPHYYSAEFSWLLIHLLLAPALYMWFIYQYRRHFTPPYLSNVVSSVWLLPLMLGTTLASGLLFFGRLALTDNTFSAQFADAVLHLVLGDLVGIAALLPISLVIRKWVLSKRWPDTRELAAILFWLAFGTVIFLLSDVRLEISTFVKIIAIFPTIYFASILGWIGTSISVFMLTVMMLTEAYLFGEPTAENQFYIIFLAITSLFLGAVMSELKSATLKLKSANRSLTHANAQLNDAVATNRKLSAQAVEMLEQERKRLSRDLHDDFGQRITDIKLTASYARQQHYQLADFMQNLMHKADQLYTSLKTSIGHLHPQGLKEVGLVDYLAKGDLAILCHDHGLNLRVKLMASLPELTEVQSISLYRICQECINNSIKYAEARHILIEFAPDKNSLSMTVSDNGKGFDPAQSGAGFGLKFMRERAAALDGRLDVHSDSEGTRISISVPLVQGAPERLDQAEPSASTAR